MRILVTGASGNAGQAVCRQLSTIHAEIRMADVVTPPEGCQTYGEFLRCDMRTPAEVRRAVRGMDAVIHLAAETGGQTPPASDATIFAVNVDGTFNLLEACRQEEIQTVVFASSMSYGWGSMDSVSKVIGEDLCRMHHHVTGAAVAMLRYHDFTAKPYLEFGAALLRNGIDRRDIAGATVAAMIAGMHARIRLFTSVIHTDHNMPEEILHDFRLLGPDWCEAQVPGAKQLLAKYNVPLPEWVEQHDLTGARQQIDWKPEINFLSFLRDLQARDARGEEVSSLTSFDLCAVPLSAGALPTRRSTREHTTRTTRTFRAFGDQLDGACSSHVPAYYYSEPR